MNTQSQFESFGKRLHQIGDKIERIAERLKLEGKIVEGDELYELGNEVEHFFDHLNAKDEVTTAQLDSCSTVNNNQASG